MNDQDKIFKEQWDKTRLKGRLVYGLTHGSLFGFVIFVLINLFKLKDQNFIDVFFTKSAIEQLITMVIAGIIGYATLKWWMNQNIYNKIIDKENKKGE